VRHLDCDDDSVSRYWTAEVVGRFGEEALAPTYRTTHIYIPTISCGRAHRRACQATIGDNGDKSLVAESLSNRDHYRGRPLPFCAVGATTNFSAHEDGFVFAWIYTGMSHAPHLIVLGALCWFSPSIRLNRKLLVLLASVLFVPITVPCTSSDSHLPPGFVLSESLPHPLRY
jgi:hypothetical protein